MTIAKEKERLKAGALKVLLIEDNEVDAKWVARSLATKSAINLMRTDVVIKHFVAGEELKKDTVTIVDRIGPEVFQRSLQPMGLKPGIKWVRSEDLISFGGTVLKGCGKITESTFEMGGNKNMNHEKSATVQDINSFSERTERVFPRWWASRPASTSSSTSFAVNRLRRNGDFGFLMSNEFQGIRMTKASLVKDTLSSREPIVCPPCGKGTTRRLQCQRNSSMVNHFCLFYLIRKIYRIIKRGKSNIDLYWTLSETP